MHFAMVPGRTATVRSLQPTSAILSAEFPGAAEPKYRSAKLYAAAAFSEDIAETVTWQQLSERLGLELRIEVKDRDGKVIYSLDPIKSPLFRARFPAVEALLASEPGALAFDARRANRHSPYL